MFPLFFFGLPIICYIVIFWPENDLHHLLLNYQKINDADEFLYHIRIFIKHAENRNIERKSKIYISGYIRNFEESCFDSNCVLKKYLEDLKVGVDPINKLYHHAEFLYQYGIRKFPACFTLRFCYWYYTFI